MPWKTWAYMERVTSPDFQSYLQDQVVAQFVSTAQRDAQWATPPKGARCITTDTNTTWLYSGTQWLPMPGVMRGIIASGPVMTPAPAVGAPVTMSTVVSGPASWLAGNTVTVPAGAGGLYLCIFDVGYWTNGVLSNGIEIKNATGVAWGLGDGYLTSTNINIMQRLNGSAILQVPDASTFRVISTGNPCDKMQLQRFTLLRVGDTFPSALSQPSLPDYPDDPNPQPQP